MAKPLGLSYCCCSVAKSCPTFCNPMDCSTSGFLSFNICWSLLKLLFIESVMPSNHLILCHPLLLLPSMFPSISIFSNDLAICIRQPKYQSFSFSISLPNEYSGLISFRIDQFDLLAVQVTLKSFLQHHSSKTSIFFSTQPSLWSKSHVHTRRLEKHCSYFSLKCI